MEEEQLWANEPPSRWYLTGFLVPSAAPMEQKHDATSEERLDAVVGSANDPAERFNDGDVDPPPRLVVRTAGSHGGTYERAGAARLEYPATPLPGPVVDAYGCGDAFAAGLTFALGGGQQADVAVRFAARCGAAVLTGRGPYSGQLRST